MDESAEARVVLAVFCDRVVEGKDNTLSLIRIIDRLTVVPPDPDDTGVRPPGIVPVTVVVGLRSEVERKGVMTVSFIGPDRVRQGNDLSIPVYLPGEEQGANFVFNAGIPSPQPGVYWMDVTLDGKSLTRSPLRVEYEAELPKVEMPELSKEIAT